MDLRKISHASIEKLGQLRRSSGFPGLGRSPEIEAGLITDLGQTGETGLLPELSSYALDANRPVREAARKVLSSLIARVPVARLLELDVWMRKAVIHWGGWKKMQPPQVARLAATDQHGAL